MTHWVKVPLGNARAGWADIGKLGAIAAIRTFLDYFLERDMTEATEQPERG